MPPACRISLPGKCQSWQPRNSGLPVPTPARVKSIARCSPNGWMWMVLGFAELTPHSPGVSNQTPALLSLSSPVLKSCNRDMTANKRSSDRGSLESMKYAIRSLTNADAGEASAVIQESFLALAAADWHPDARSVFLEATAPAALQNRLITMTFAAGAFSDDEMAGVILMPSPSLLGALFVRPRWLRLGIGQALWETARRHIEARFSEVNTVELNATPYAVPFYKSVGFAPISSEYERDGQRAVRMACWLPARALGATAL
jgi:GNAT superfamily N-acetyltransferase